MGLKSKKILGISVTISQRNEILEYIEKYLKNTSNFKLQTLHLKKSPLVIVTPNPEQIVLAQEDKRFAQILSQADVALPDGIGLALALRVFGSPHSPITRHSSLVRIPGVELMEALVEVAAAKGYSIGLIGGRGGVAVEALECLKRKYPGLHGWAMEPEGILLGDLGYLGYLSEKIQKTHTRLVFVGLGAPKQEYFIESLSHSLSFRPPSRNPGRKTWIPGSFGKSQDRQARDDNKNIVLMSVGGAFDIIAGRLPRAPLIVRALGLEWLWRLLRQPWRWHRQLALVKFLWLVVWEKLASQGIALRS